MDQTPKQKQVNNVRLAVMLGLGAVGMVGMAYAAVPLYQLFCQVTGFGGTTQVAQASDHAVLDRTMKVRFMANTHRDMPWEFKPSQSEQVIKVGENTLAFYEATNNTDETIVGTAIFNVTPHKAGVYFSKIDCFCFTEQVLKPGQRVDMPVTYFIDPEIADDPHLDEVTEIVLSYTFFRKQEAEAAVVAQSDDS